MHVWTRNWNVISLFELTYYRFSKQFQLQISYILCYMMKKASLVLKQARNPEKSFECGHWSWISFYIIKTLRMTNKTITKLLFCLCWRSYANLLFFSSIRRDGQVTCCLNLARVWPECVFSAFSKFLGALCRQMSESVSQWADWG